MKVHYDFVFGIGQGCVCSQTLRRAGLQFLSFPGDWIASIWTTPERPSHAHDLCARTDMLCSGMANLFDPDDFVFQQPHPWNGMDMYVNRRNNYVFYHDFPHGVDFRMAFPRIVKKYRRRFERLQALIRGARRVLVVRIDIPGGKFPTTPDDCRYARKRLEAAFAPTRFDIALLTHAEGIAFEQMREELPEDGFFHFAFDYLNRAPNAEKNQPDLAKTARLFASRFAVKDYRTPQEIKSHRLAKKQKKWAAVGAKGPLDYLFKRLLARIGLSDPGRQADGQKPQCACRCANESD